MSKPSDPLQTRLRESLAKVSDDQRARESALGQAIGYLMGSGLTDAAVAIALGWPTLFPGVPLPDRMGEALGIAVDIISGDY